MHQSMITIVCRQAPGLRTHLKSSKTLGYMADDMTSRYVMLFLPCFSFKSFSSWRRLTGGYPAPGLPCITTTSLLLPVYATSSSKNSATLQEGLLQQTEPALPNDQILLLEASTVVRAAAVLHTCHSITSMFAIAWQYQVRHCYVGLVDILLTLLSLDQVTPTYSNRTNEQYLDSWLVSDDSAGQGLWEASCRLPQVTLKEVHHTTHRAHSSCLQQQAYMCYSKYLHIYRSVSSKLDNMRSTSLGHLAHCTRLLTIQTQP